MGMNRTQAGKGRPSQTKGHAYVRVNPWRGCRVSVVKRCGPGAGSRRTWHLLQDGQGGSVIGEGFAAVLTAAQEGSETAFSLLWRDGNPPLLRYVRVLAPEAAEDVAAETWLQVVRGLAGFRGDEQAWRAWLFTTARRRAIDYSRHRARRPAGALDEVPPGLLPITSDAADLALEQIGTRWAVALLAGLPAIQAEVILLRVVAGMDTETVAQLVGRSRGAVRVAAHRGLRRLAEILPEPGVTL